MSEYGSSRAAASLSLSLLWRSPTQLALSCSGGKYWRASPLRPGVVYLCIVAPLSALLLARWPLLRLAPPGPLAARPRSRERPQRRARARARARLSGAHSRARSTIAFSVGAAHARTPWCPPHTHMRTLGAAPWCQGVQCSGAGVAVQSSSSVGRAPLRDSPSKDSNLFLRASSLLSIELHLRPPCMRPFGMESSFGSRVFRGLLREGACTSSVYFSSSPSFSSSSSPLPPRAVRYPCFRRRASLGRVGKRCMQGLAFQNGYRRHRSSCAVR